MHPTELPLNYNFFQDCVTVNYFLGIKIRYDHATGCMYLTQEDDVDHVLTKFGMQASNSVKTSMEKGCFLPARAANPVSHSYRQLLGSLMYMIPGAFPKLGEAHWQALKRVVRYMKVTKKLKLQYKMNDDA